MRRSIQAAARGVVFGCAVMIGSAGMATAQAATISFGVPSWPGVTVKTEIMKQLLDSLGYQTETNNLGLPFVYRGLASGDTDVFMGAWLPAEHNMLDPLVKKHQVYKLRSNLSGAIEGLAVPDYVWNQGIHSVKDLAAHGDMFEHKIYAIEAGSAMDEKIAKAIDGDYDGLGGWKMVPSSTAVMLAQVTHFQPAQTPVVFLGWRPHWMNIKFDIHYLNDRKNSEIAGIESDVLTLVSTPMKKDHPNVVALLDHFHVEAETQSQWIYDYSYKKNDKAEVARDWLNTHPDQVEGWLKGVATADGGPAVSAYRKAFGTE